MRKFMKPWILASIVLLLSGTALSWRYLSASDEGGTNSLVLPKFSTLAAKGQDTFNANCTQCHGVNAIGSDSGPPLVHDIYNPGHHGDAAFYRAAKLGSPQHHWSFGDMPPQPEVNDADMAAIIRFIRELQEANGIFYRQHQM